MAGPSSQTIRNNNCYFHCPVIASVLTLFAVCCAASTAALAQPATTGSEPAATLSTLTPGESWAWSITGTFTPAGSTQALPLSGNQVEDVEVLPFQGSPTLAFVATQNLSAGGVPLFGSQPPPASVFYFTQDPTTRTVYAIGDNQSADGSLRVSQQPAEFIPGQWSPTTSYSSLLVFPSGETANLLLNVTGTTTVTTALGNFAAWVAPTNDLDSSGVTHPGTDYWTPELGAPAKFETATTLPDGSAIQITGTLTAASILGGPSGASPGTSVPEPASLALLGCGLLGFAAVRRRAA